MGIQPRDLMIYAIKALTERRLRAVLTIIGIAIGPLALVMMTSVISGYSNYVERQILGLGQNLVVLFPTRDYRFSQKDIDYIETLDGISDVRPFYSTQGVMKSPTGEKKVFIYAVDPDIILKTFSGLRIVEGAIPSPNEVTSAIIGYKIAYDPITGEKLFEVGDVIQITIAEVVEASKIKIKRLYVRVVGILNEYGGAPFLSPDNTIFLPYGAGKRVLGVDDWSGILVLAVSPVYVDYVAKQLRQAYRDAAEVISFVEIARVVSSVTAAMGFITFATSLSAFAVATVGIAATMITSVIERTREIGVLKALGFTDGQVMSLILSEGIVMSIIGGIIGIILGVIGANMLATRGFTIRGATELRIYAPPLITPELIIRTFIITIIIGILGGLFPAYRAAKIPPAVALRYE